MSSSDTLSYSGGALPEQQLADPRLKDIPVLVCFGDKDPWTPSERVPRSSGLSRSRVVPLEGVGHCPHDEAPEVVNPLLAEFVTRRAAAVRRPKPWRLRRTLINC